MRNVFDQYDQPENKLTHALVATLHQDLHQDRRLIRPFLRWLGIQDAPATRAIRIVEQQVPGSEEVDHEDAARGLPDACIFDDSGWAVLFECKVQARASSRQIRRHVATAARHGFERAQVVVITVDPVAFVPDERTRVIEWKDVYHWFSRRSAESTWAKLFVEYMRVFETKMTAKDYQIRGTITMFDGVRFDEHNPYTYPEGKRLIRLLGDGLQARKDLQRLGVDPKGKRRSAITGRGLDGVWDFLPLKVAHGAKHFTAYPHLTMNLRDSMAIAAVTVPNGVRGGFRTKLADLGPDGFRSLVCELEAALRPLLNQSKGAKPMMCLWQRHYYSRSSPPEVDARVEVDVRTAVAGGKWSVKHQPQWIDAIYDVLSHKKSNMQFGVQVRFDYECSVLRSRQAVDLFAKTWIALWPLVDFVLRDK